VPSLTSAIRDAGQSRQVQILATAEVDDVPDRPSSHDVSPPGMEPAAAASKKLAGQATLSVYLLGTFQVLVNERTVPASAWHGRKAAELVKVLALEPGHRLHREQVMELLWPEHAPDLAANAFYKALHHARRVLEPDLAQGRESSFLHLQGELVVLTAPGVLWVDAETFERAAAEARQRRTIPAYEAALALYRGDLLPEDRYLEWAERWRDRLRETALTLEMELAELQEQQGDVHLAIALLREVIATDPLREAAHAHLMRLYAQTGQRSQAIRQYRELVRMLRAELDVEPAPETQALYQAINEGCIPVAVKPPGRRHVHLPVPTTSFIGRTQELTDLRALVSAHRLVTLTGPGGCGKSRLALELASRTADLFPDGACYVELSPIIDGALVVTAVAHALGIPSQAQRSLLDAILDDLAPRSLLLVLDNCEHVLSACIDLTRTLLARAPRLHILLTSREALRVPGEVVWPVPPLSLPADDAPLTPDALRQSEAVQLFLARAQESYPAFRLTERNSAAIQRICHMLAGLPLALELAAAWIGPLTAEELAQRLEANLFALESRQRDLPERQRSLRAMLDWSYQRLEPAAQQLFRRLAVFADGFTVGAASAVCAGDAVVPERIVALLGRLLDVSLLTVEQRDDEAWYRLLEPVRWEAATWLAAHGELEPTHRRHATYAVALVEQADHGLRGPEAPRWMQILRREYNNLRLALSWSLTSQDILLAGRLASGLAYFWEITGQFEEGHRWLEHVLAYAPMLPATLRCQLQLGLSWILARQGIYHQAESVARAVLNDPEATEHLRAYAQTALGRIAIDCGQYTDAVTYLSASVARARVSGDAWLLLRSLHLLGVAFLYQSQVMAADACFAEVVTLGQQTGALDPLAVAWNGWGLVAWQQGKHTLAATRLAESLRCAQELGYQVYEGLSLANLGIVLADQGDWAHALQTLREALGYFVRSGNLYNIGLYLIPYGIILANLGCLEIGVSCISAGFHGLAAIGSHPPAYVRWRIELDLKAIRAQLAPDVFEAQWEAGRSMPLLRAAEAMLVVPVTLPEDRAIEGKRTGPGSSSPGPVANVR